MTSTPISPTAVASQRRTPTLSPRNTIDSAVTNSGETKPVADASAIGRNRKPEMKNSDEHEQRHAAHAAANRDGRSAAHTAASPAASPAT